MDLSFEDLRSIACTQPRLAYWLCRAERIWTTYQMAVTWTTGAQNQQPLSTALPKPIGCDFYVRDLCFTIRRPNAFFGSVFKAQSDAQNMFDSGINVNLTVDGCPKYTITDGPTPIELVARPATLPDSCCISFPLTATQVLRAIFTLSRNLDQGQSGTQVFSIGTGSYTVNGGAPISFTAGAALPGLTVNGTVVTVGIGYVYTFLVPAGGPFVAGAAIPSTLYFLGTPTPNGEIPTTVILVLRGYQLPCSMYGGVSVEEAVADLQGRGLLDRTFSLAA